jgi:predicted DNA binding CopG/RHH family protein
MRFVFLELDTGARGKKSMSKKLKYKDGPIDDVEIIEDFLPSPEELAMKEETIKVTIMLSRSSVEFFKEKATKNQMAYQKMIRKLLDSYVDRHIKS